MQVKDVAAKHWETFEAERSKQPFENFTDFMLRTQFNETELENLIRCGACDSFTLNRPQMMWLLKAMYSSIVQQRDRSTLIGASIMRIPKVPRLRDYTEDQKLKYEMQLLDLAVTKHPLHLFKPWKRVRNFVPAKHLKDYKDEFVQLIGWLVTTKPSSTSKKERMLFATFEDTETLFETTLFPRTYNKCAHLLVNRGPYLVQGNVDEDHGVFSVIVEGLKNLNYER
jgi:DNA polymerase III alpha subunit